MNVSRFVRPALALVAIVVIAGCGRHSQIDALPATSAALSPGLIPVAPMVKTQILPASVMLNAHVKPDVALQAASYTQIPGSATFAAASYDGSLWVLSDQPAGPDKYIWHYSGGTWTNIPGLASRIVVRHDANAVYAINSSGGIYEYTGGTWTSPGGGASDIAIDLSGALYVLSNSAGVGADEPAWVYNGSWAPSPGSGVRIVSSNDSGNYAILNGSGNSGGIYILNAAGDIYHEFPDSGPAFQHLPGHASALTATDDGGVFVLGYPASGSGTGIYYLDLDSGNYNTVAGSGVAISTNSQKLYVISSNGGIYSSPVLVAPTWTFSGSSTTATFSTGTTTTATLASYANISASMQFGQTTSGNGTMTISDALNNGEDITPNTLPTDNATSGFTPVLYLSLFNAGPTSFSTGTMTPAVTITKTTGFGAATSCELDIYINTGSGGGTRTWNNVGASGTVSGTTVTVPSVALPGGSTVDFQPAQTAAAISCH